jgi:hypothetical protein
MDSLNRRRILKYIGGAGIAFGTGGYLFADQINLRTFRFKSSVGLVPTRQQYIRGQPSFSEGEKTLQATILRNRRSAKRRLFLSRLPEDLSNRLKENYNSGFWVATVAILPNTSTYNLGSAKFEEDTLTYPNVEATERETKNKNLKYHYIFHYWVKSLPIGKKPKAAAANWIE